MSVAIPSSEGYYAVLPAIPVMSSSTMIECYNLCHYFVYW